MILSKYILVILIFAITTFLFVNSIEANVIAPSIAYGKSRTSLQSLSHRTKLPSVRITSPIRGQNVPAGKSFVVSGISASRSTSSCVVSVTVNGIKPYQNATAIGPKGQKDYSRWTFPVNPKYTTIKAGINKIASKISCNKNPDLVSYYTLNVTGLAGSGRMARSSVHSPVAITNNAPQIATPLP